MAPRVRLSQASHSHALASLRTLGAMVTNIARAKISGDDALMSPLFMSWEINSACNLRCPYCYFHQRSYGFSDKGLSWDDMKRVLRRIKAVTQDLMVLGGEPFLHPCWNALVDYCYDELGLRVRCITNGTLLEKHLRSTGRLHLLVVSYDYTRVRVYPKEMAEMQRQLAAVVATYPRLTVLINFVLCAEDDTGWVVEQLERWAARGYNVFVNVDRYRGGSRVDPRIVETLQNVKRRTGRVHMTDVTLNWLRDTRRPVPFCEPTLLPLLDPQARLIYPCCYFDEQQTGNLLDMGYTELLKRSVARFGRYPFEKCARCTTTAYLDATVSLRRPAEGIRHYHALYNRLNRP